MNVRFSLPVVVIALFSAAWASSTWAQAGAEAEVKPVEWPHTPAGRWANGPLQAHNTEGNDALRGVVAPTDLATCLRVGSVADPPCIGSVWRI